MNKDLLRRLHAGLRNMSFVENVKVIDDVNEDGSIKYMHLRTFQCLLRDNINKMISEDNCIIHELDGKIIYSCHFDVVIDENVLLFCNFISADVPRNKKNAKLHVGYDPSMFQQGYTPNVLKTREIIYPVKAIVNSSPCLPSVLHDFNSCELLKYIMYYGFRELEKGKFEVQVMLYDEGRYMRYNICGGRRLLREVSTYKTKCDYSGFKKKMVDEGIEGVVEIDLVADIISNHFL